MMSQAPFKIFEDGTLYRSLIFFFLPSRSCLYVFLPFLNQFAHSFASSNLVQSFLISYLANEGETPTKTPGAQTKKKSDIAKLPGKSLDAGDMPKTAPIGLDEKAPKTKTGAKSRPFGSVLSNSHLNTNRKHTDPNSNTPFPVEPQTSSTTQKLSSNRPTAVQLSLDDESEDTQNSIKAQDIDPTNLGKSNMKTERASEKKYSNNNVLEEEEIEIDDGGVFDDVDMEEAFCTRKGPYSGFNPNDDPVGLVHERLKLLRSDPEKYSMKWDYLDSDVFDETDQDDEKESKKKAFEDDAEDVDFKKAYDEAMWEVHKLDIEDHFRTYVGVIPDFMEENFAELEQELIDEGLMKSEMILSEDQIRDFWAPER